MIDIHSLAFSYRKGKGTPVLDRLDLRIPSGHIYGLLGPNGIGKTTLLHLLSGLKKPQMGEIRIDGNNPFDRHPSFLEHLAFVPDEMPGIREEPVDYALSRGRFYPAFSPDLFRSLLSVFNVDSAKRISAMSYGERKKTYIAFHIACQNTYLFLDEPTNGMDLSSKALFRKALAAHSKEDSTILIATHQLADIEDIIDSVIILDRKGEVLCLPIDEIGRRLRFEYDTVTRQDAVWTERLPSGCVQICPNPERAETRCHIGALYNAFYGRKEQLLQAMSKSDQLSDK